jgi:hypothetical protein
MKGTLQSGEVDAEGVEIDGGLGHRDPQLGRFLMDPNIARSRLLAKPALAL